MNIFFFHVDAHIDIRRWNRQCSETLVYKFQAPGNHPKESIQHHIDMFNVYVCCVTINSIAHEDLGLPACWTVWVNCSDVQMDHSAIVSGLLDREYYSTAILWNVRNFVLKTVSRSWRLEASVTPLWDILIVKPTRCTNFSNLFLEYNSTCFGQFLRPSSGV